jgi:hypothetical protein
MPYGDDYSPELQDDAGDWKDRPRTSAPIPDYDRTEETVLLRLPADLAEVVCRRQKLDHERRKRRAQGRSGG